MAGTADAAVVDVLGWNGFGGGSVGSAGVQASPTNPLITPADLVAHFTYNGSLNFNAIANNIGSFFASGGGVLSNFTTGSQAALNATTMSTATFAATTVVELTGFVSAPISGVITHDDGIYLQRGGINVASGGTASTIPENTAFSLGVGTANLFYVATNNLPEVLNAMALNTLAAPPEVPKPASLALLGSALAELGVVVRRRRKNI